MSAQEIKSRRPGFIRRLMVVWTPKPTVDPPLARSPANSENKTPRHGGGRLTGTCEMIRGGAWRRVSVETAIAAKSGNPEFAVRCPECHGAIRLHRASKAGARAHFEHPERNETCVLGGRRLRGARGMASSRSRDEDVTLIRTFGEVDADLT